MSEPFDLDALAAEATGESFTFTAGGRDFRLLPASQLDWHAAQALANNDFAAALRGLLGEQYADFDRLPLSVHAVGKLLEAWGKHNGLAPGESPASTSS